MAAARPHVDVSFVDPNSIEVIEPQMGLRGRTTLTMLLLAGIAMVVYARALGGEFLYLDEQTVAQNLTLRSWGQGLRIIWLHPTILPHYQPLAYSLFLLEFKLFKAQWPAGYLAVNVLLHASNVVLFWIILKRLEVAGALAAAILFAVHPINVQAVGWISQQPILWCGLFSLLAILILLRWSGITPSPPDTGKIVRLPAARSILYAICAVLLASAMASHPIAVVLPLVLLVIIWWERGRLAKGDLQALLPLLLLSAIWIVVSCVADYRRAVGLDTLPNEGVLARLLFRIGAGWMYLWHFVFPFGLSLVYPRSSKPGWTAVVVLISASCVLLMAWKLREKKGRGPFAAVTLLGILLMPTFVFHADLDLWSDLADHLLYLPAMVLAVGIVAVVQPLARSTRRWPGALAATTLAVGLGLLTVLRLGEYHDSSRLWNAVLARYPDSLIAHNSLGLIELDEKHFAAARVHFTEALQAHPQDLATLLNIARSYEIEGDFDKAIWRYQEAMTLAPDDPQVHLGMGSALAGKGNTVGAIEQFKLVLRKVPGHYLATYWLGMAYQRQGDSEQAVRELEEAIKLNPAEAAPYIDLANIDFAHGRFAEALAKLNSAVAIDPRNYRIYLNVGANLGALAEDLKNNKQQDELRHEAETYLRHAAALEPKSPDAAYDLGIILYNQGRLDEAIFQLRKAVELSPTDLNFKQALDLAKMRQSQENRR